MKYKFNIVNLDCPNCANKIEQKLNQNEKIIKANIDFNNLTMTIITNEKGNVLKFINDLLLEIDPGVKVTKLTDNNIKNNAIKNNSFFLVTATILFILGNIISNHNISSILIIISYLLLLNKIVINGIKKLIKFNIDENLLITISCIGAYFTNHINEGFMVIWLYDIGKILENIAVNNSRKSIKELMDIKPEYANLYKDKKIIKVNPTEVSVGDIIAIKPGEKIPLDGIVTKGESKINTQSITGESKLLEIKKGDNVLSGTINTTDLIYLKVTSDYTNSTVSKVLSLIDDASTNKAKTETLVSKIARIYTPIIIFLAIISFIIMPFIFDLTIKESLYRSLLFLVVSCPCAIAISIPLSYFSGLGAASREGILIKGSNYLDVISNIDEIIFDKTGTISKGLFSSYQLIILHKEYSKKEILKYYVSGESLSNHPIAKSLIKMIDVKPYDKIENFKETSGLGISYKVNENQVKIGSYKFCKVKSDSSEAIYLNVNGENIAKIILQDEIKENAKEIITKIKSMGIDVQMYTGDNEKISAEIASKVGIDNYCFSLLPQDKYKLIKKEINNNKRIAFVGDGVNDAPSLAISNIGISMGGIGSDAAIEASDIVIMDDNLNKIIKTIDISKYTKKIILENLIVALTVKAIILVLSFFGVSTMWEAVFADTGVTLLAIINTTRILKRKY